MRGILRWAGIRNSATRDLRRLSAISRFSIRTAVVFVPSNHSSAQKVVDKVKTADPSSSLIHKALRAS